MWTFGLACFGHVATQGRGRSPCGGGWGLRGHRTPRAPHHRRSAGRGPRGPPAPQRPGGAHHNHHEPPGPTSAGSPSGGHHDHHERCGGSPGAPHPSPATPGASAGRGLPRVGLDDRAPLPPRPARPGVLGASLRDRGHRRPDDPQPEQLGVGPLAVPRRDVGVHDRDPRTSCRLLRGRADRCSSEAVALVGVVAVVLRLDVRPAPTCAPWLPHRGRGRGRKDSGRRDSTGAARR